MKKCKTACNEKLRNALFQSMETLSTTVKHVYSDHAYNEMTLITKHLGIPSKHFMYFFINFTLTAKLHTTKTLL